MSELDAKESIARIIESLDRICSACLAATDQASWDLLHRGRECKTKKSRQGAR